MLKTHACFGGVMADPDTPWKRSEADRQFVCENGVQWPGAN